MGIAQMQSPISLGYKSYVLYLSVRAFTSTTAFGVEIYPRLRIRIGVMGKGGPMACMWQVLPSEYDAHVREGVKRSPPSCAYRSNVRYIRVREELGEKFRK